MYGCQSSSLFQCRKTKQKETAHAQGPGVMEEGGAGAGPLIRPLEMDLFSTLSLNLRTKEN